MEEEPDVTFLGLAGGCCGMKGRDLGEGHKGDWRGGKMPWEPSNDICPLSLSQRPQGS